MRCGHPTTYDSGWAQNCGTDSTCPNYDGVRVGDVVEHQSQGLYSLEPGTTATMYQIVSHGYVYHSNASNHDCHWTKNKVYNSLSSVCVAGPPGSTDHYTVKQLEDRGYIGVYMPPGVSKESIKQDRR